MELWEKLLGDLRQEFQLREEELTLLNYIDQQLLRDDRPDEALFAHVIRRLQQILDSYRTRILLRRGQYLENTYSTIPSDVGQRVPQGSSEANDCITSNRTINLGLINPGEPAEVDGIPIPHSVIATPIRFRDRPIGALCAESTAANAFSVSHEDAMEKVAAQLALALQHVQSSDVAALFNDLDVLVFSHNESSTVIRSALDRVIEELRKQKLPFSGAQIMFHKGEDELEIVYSTNPSDVGVALKIHQSVCGRAMREKRTVVLDDVSSDPSYVRLLGSDIKSEIAVPIFAGAGGSPIGVLNVESTELEVFGGFNEVAMTGFADRVGVLLAFTKLRADVTESLELRSHNALMAAVGDQASHMIHRLSNTVGAMRFRILELQDMLSSNELDADELGDSLSALLELADRTLDMPRRVTHLLGAGDSGVDLNRIVRTAIGDLEIPERISVELVLSDLVTVKAPKNFDIVIQNLVQNAVDAMQSHGILTVSSSVRPQVAGEAQTVDITVTDTGHGIAPDVLPRIFDLSFSTKPAARRGMGFGLFWVRNFVRRLGGEIHVTSTVGAGAEFLVRLPMANGVDE